MTDSPSQFLWTDLLIHLNGEQANTAVALLNDLRRLLQTIDDPAASGAGTLVVTLKIWAYYL